MDRPTTTLVVAVLLAVTLAGAACSGDDDKTSGSADPGPTSAASATAATSPDDTASMTAAAVATSTSWAPAGSTTPAADPALDLADGRHAVYLTAVDVEGRTLTFDVFQFLTGQEAVDAYHGDFPDDPEGPPNDYYMVNENPRLRTAPVAADVDVALVRLSEDSDADLDPGTFEELPVYLAATPPADSAALSYSPFWLTLDGGVITAIEEQYLP